MTLDGGNRSQGLVDSTAPTHLDVATAFDSLAEQYDGLFGQNAVIVRLRRKVYSTIDFLVRPPARILDINCGTGTDGIYLAQEGFSVTGVDISTRMITEATRKSQGLPNLHFLQGSYENLDKFEPHQFDLVLSNFGGLNCSNNLSVVAAQVAEKLKPGGYFIAMIMPSFSLWETLAYAFRGKLTQAFRRIRSGGTETQFSGNRFVVYYFSFHDFARAFSTAFQIIEWYSLNVFSPPPHAWRIGTRFPQLTRAAERFDDLTCRLPVIRTIGDHTVFVLRRKSK